MRTVTRRDSWCALGVCVMMVVIAAFCACVGGGGRAATEPARPAVPGQECHLGERSGGPFGGEQGGDPGLGPIAQSDDECDVEGNCGPVTCREEGFLWWKEEVCWR